MLDAPRNAHATNPGDASTTRARAIARELAQVFAKTAVARDKQGGTAKAERDLIRRSGLLRLIVPVEQGGWGGAWPEALDTVRILARADGSLGHLYGFHHLLLATLRLFGAEEQWSRWFAETTRNDWFWGNALNPLDRRSTIVPRGGGEYVINGTKSFCSGASDSDMLVVSAIRPGESRLVVAAIPTSRSGIRVNDDWDNMGQRQTDSGSVVFQDVVVLESEILQSPGPLGSVFASLRSCIAQLVLANVYLGITEGAFEAARDFTRTEARAWHTSGVDTPTRDPYVLERYGEFHVELEAARLLTDRAALLLDEAWRLGDALEPRQRAEVAVAIAAAKVKTTRVGLELSSRVFEVMGPRATTARLGSDRFWRNLRTHTLHDPVDYKLRDLGAWALNEESPVPSFYS